MHRNLDSNKKIAQLAAIGVAILAILIAPLSNSVLIGSPLAYAQDEFPTVVPTDVEFEEAFEGDLGQVIYVPGTLGPIEDWRLPLVTRPEFLDDPFGYSEILGEPGHYLIWSTDGSGNKRYFIIDETNEKLTNIRDAVDGFRDARLRIEADPPAARIAAGVVGTALFGVVSIGCGGAAVVTGILQLWPLTAAFVGCDAIAVPLTVASGSTAWNAVTRAREFSREVEEHRRQVESDFAQLPFIGDN